MKRSDWPMRANGGGRRGGRGGRACAAGAVRDHHMSDLRVRRLTFAGAVKAKFPRGSARTGMVQ